MTKNITQLPAAAALVGTEVFPVIQSGVDVKATISAILAIASNATQAELDTVEAALTVLINAKAADSTVVKLTGAQTVAGVKTFSSAPVVPAAAFPEAAVAGLVADLTATVKLTGAQTVAGVKTFSDSPAVPDNSWSIADTSGLQTALDAKVALTGNQTVAGDKTFTGGVIVKADAMFDVRGHTGWDPIAATNDTAFTNARAAAVTAGGGTVLIPRLLKISTDHLIAQGTNLFGPGAGPVGAAAEIRCTAAGARVSFGDITTARNGGVSQGFLINGNYVATNPLYIGVDVGRTFTGIDVIDSTDANIVLQGTQNCTFIEVNAQGGPDQIRLERGAMTNLFLRCEFNDSTRYNCHVRANGAAPVAVGSNLPSYNHFLRCIFERGAGGAGAIIFLHDAGAYNVLDGCVLADGGAAGIPTVCKIAKPGTEVSHSLIFDGDTTLQTNYAAGASVGLDLGDNTTVYNNGTLHIVGTDDGIKHNTSGYFENAGFLDLASVTNATSGPAFYADLLIRQRHSFPSAWTRPVAENALQVRAPGDTNNRFAVLGNGDVQRGDGTAAAVKVIGTRGAAVADATGGATVDTEARAAINALLARLRAATGHGLIA